MDFAMVSGSALFTSCELGAGAILCPRRRSPTKLRIPMSVVAKVELQFSESYHCLFL